MVTRPLSDTEGNDLDDGYILCSVCCRLSKMGSVCKSEKRLCCILSGRSVRSLRSLNRI